MSVTWELGTDEIDDEAAVRVTSGGNTKEGFSIRKKCCLRRMVDVGEMEIVSGVSDGITEADDRFVTATWWFWRGDDNGVEKEK